MPVAHPSFLPLLLLLPLLPLLAPPSVHSTLPPPPYLSPATFAADYDDMLGNFRIFVYDAARRTFKFKSEAESLFLASLLGSPFVTENPSEAHLFFVPFDGGLSERSVARVVRDLRADHPYWNRTLGADHFYASCDGIGFGSDRNLLELKKNAVQLSCFPASGGRFVPHKDVALPPAAVAPAGDGGPRAPPPNGTAEHLAYARLGAIKDPGLTDRLAGDRDFLIESEPSDRATIERRLAASEFCLFDLGGDVSWIGDAMRFGCVPVVITDRSIQDLPLIDVLRWQEMAVFVGSAGGAEAVKRALTGLTRERLERMRESCVAASRHFAWNRPPQPLDAFHMVVYQLWLRRHTIRYARRDFS
ncbi:probable glycosyltransferase At3g07620 [Eucalyptus grandis]|uniref:probable glycosyltransferase At3g07620 n=1 Tax=Eucalyptus grandis TaxID=71139 RepID=UPI0005273CD5|nr:probable glycosyltransferase At3g07620 [Eucalyptus grandis]